MRNSGLGNSPLQDRVEVNTTDLRRAIAEGLAPMHKMLDPDHNRLPYFYNQVVGPDIGLSHHISYSLSHVPGRWLNAILSAEDSVGISSDEKLVELSEIRPEIKKQIKI